VPLIFVQALKQRRVLLTGLDLASFDEKDQLGLPVSLRGLSHDPNAAMVLARSRHVETPCRLSGRSFYVRIIREQEVIRHAATKI